MTENSTAQHTPGAAAGVGRRFVTLGAGEAAARVIGFGATIYVARQLGAGGYGVVAFAAAVVLYLTYLADFAVETLGVRDVAAAPARVSAVVPSLLVARFLIALALIVLVGGGGLVALPDADGAVLAVACLTLLPDAFSTRWVHLGLERPGAVAAARLLAAVTGAAAVLVLVRDGGDLARVPLAQLLGETVGAVLLLALLRRAAGPLAVALRGDVVGPTFRRAWPLVAHSMLGLVVFNADYLFLRAFQGAAVVGWYAAAYALISFLLNVGLAYGFSLLPALTRADAAPAERQQLYDAAHAQAFAVTLPVAVGSTLLAPAIIGLVFGPAYAPAGPALAVLIWSIPFALLRTVCQTALIATGRQADVLRTVTWAAALNVGANAIVVPRYGMLGAATVTVATELLRAALAVVFARRTGLAFPGWRRFWRAGLGAAVMAGALLALAARPVWITIPVGVLVFGAVLLATGGIVLTRGHGPALRV